MTSNPPDLRLHGDTFARGELLDFAVNVWPGGHPVPLRRSLEKALREPGYPDQTSAINAIAHRHERSPDEVLLLNGACEGFWLLAHALRPKRAICVHPSFTEPEAAFRAVGADVVHAYRGSEFALDPDAVPTDGDIVVLGNPNNPTGNLDPAHMVEQLARPDRLLIVDESFMEFIPDEDESLASRADIPGLIIVRSITKLWSLAGVRAGYLLASPELVEKLAAQRQPWSVSSPACAALAYCMGDRRYRRRVATMVAEAREELALALERISGVKTWPSVANFLLLEVDDAPEVISQLRDAGIAVRPAHSFPGLSTNHVRVAVRHAVDNQRLARALRKILVDEV
jgi:histidinol-phosphate aminotransferase